jgi:hypothetical protein
MRLGDLRTIRHAQEPIPAWSVQLQPAGLLGQGVLGRISREIFMTKKHLAYLLASTLLTAPAIAQTSSSPNAPSPSPSTPSASDSERSGAGTQNRASGNQAASPSAAGGSSAGATSSSQQIGVRSSMSASEVNKALAAPGPNQMLASDIRGTRVYGANNENVGDINDILLAQNGDIVALVVGVGGFLGIGQKDVAIPFQAFEFVTEGQRVSGRTNTTTTSSNPGSNATSNATRDASSNASRNATNANANARTGSSMTASGASPDAPSASNAQPGGPSGIPSASGISGTTNSSNASNASSTESSPASGTAASSNEPVTTGSTSTRTTTTTSATQQSAGLLKPERIVLRGRTKADLEAAPEFKRNAVATGSSAPARSGATNR